VRTIANNNIMYTFLGNAESLKNAAKAATKSLDGFDKAVQKSNRTTASIDKSINGLAKSMKAMSTGAGLVKKAFEILAGVKLADTLADSVKESVSYVENLNLFTVAMEDSIEAGKEFVSTVQELYGMDPSSIMRYAGNFYQLSDAIDAPTVASERMSLGLTKAAIDVASLFNMPIETVMGNFSSGMQGMTRAVRKYGIDIRIATLRTAALKLGLDDNVATMNEANRQGLRYLTILRQVSKASGDFAKTIESPANQLKIMSEQFRQLGRAIGNFFLIPLKQVLPYINGVIMALRTMLTFLATLAGFEPIEFGGGVSGAEEMEHQIAGVGGAADEATKKLKQMLAPFDELNIIKDNTPNQIAGVDGSLETMDPAILKAIQDMELNFEKVEMKANRVRDAVLDFLGYKRADDGTLLGWDPQTFEDNLLGRLPQWKKSIDAIFTNWSSITDSLGGLGSSIWESINIVLEPLKEVFSNIFSDEAIASAIAGIPGVLDRLGDVFLDWAPIFQTIPTMLANAFKALQDDVDWENLASHARNLYDSLVPFASKVGEGLVWFWDNFMIPLGTWVLNSAVPALLDLLAATLDWLGAKIENGMEVFQWLYDEFLVPLGTWTGDIVILAIEKLTEVIEWLAERTSGAMDRAKEMFSAFTDGIEPVRDSIIPVFETLGDVVKSLYENVIEPLASFFTTTFKSAIELVWTILNQLWKDVFKPFGEFLLAVFGPVIWVVIEVFKFLHDKVLKPLKDYFVGEFWSNFEWVMKAIHTTIDGFTDVLNGLIKFITGIFSGDWSMAWDGIKQLFQGLWEGISGWIPDKLTQIGEDIFNYMWDGLLNVWNKLKSWISDKVEWIGEKLKFWEKAEDKMSEDNSRSGGTSVGSGGNARGSYTLNSPNPRLFARGGLTGAGELFRAGEGGKYEVIGNYGGSTTVMPLENTGFVQAMYNAIFEAVTDAQGGGQPIIVQIGEDTIIDTVVSGINRKSRISGVTVVHV
jgi:phage-related protein